MIKSHAVKAFFDFNTAHDENLYSEYCQENTDVKGVLLLNKERKLQFCDPNCGWWVTFEDDTASERALNVLAEKLGDHFFEAIKQGAIIAHCASTHVAAEVRLQGFDIANWFVVPRKEGVEKVDNSAFYLASLSTFGIF